MGVADGIKRKIVALKELVFEAVSLPNSNVFNISVAWNTQKAEKGAEGSSYFVKRALEPVLR